MLRVRVKLRIELTVPYTLQPHEGAHSHASYCSKFVVDCKHSFSGRSKRRSVSDTPGCPLVPDPRNSEGKQEMTVPRPSVEACLSGKCTVAVR